MNTCMFYCLESVRKSVRTYCHAFCHHLYLVQGARSSPTAQTTVARPMIKIDFYILLAEFQWFSLKLKMLSPIWPYEKWIIKNRTTFSSWKVVSPELKINSRWSDDRISIPFKTFTSTAELSGSLLLDFEPRKDSTFEIWCCVPVKWGASSW